MLQTIKPSVSGTITVKLACQCWLDTITSTYFGDARARMLHKATTSNVPRCVCVLFFAKKKKSVVCGTFAPTGNLIASASLDQTVRVWDCSDLYRKHKGGKGPTLVQSGKVVQHIGESPPVKFVLRGHKKSVNWVSFHPTLPLLASASDDQDAKLWQFFKTRVWQVGTLSCHTGNVTGALFVANQDKIVTSSQDGSIRLWDRYSRLQTHIVLCPGRDGGCFRLGSLVLHASRDLCAAGHDSGIVLVDCDQTPIPAKGSGPNTENEVSKDMPTKNTGIGSQTEAEDDDDDDDGFDPPALAWDAASPEPLLAAVDGPSLEGYNDRDSVYVGTSTPVVIGVKLEVPVTVSAAGSIVSYETHSESPEVSFKIVSEMDGKSTTIKVRAKWCKMWLLGVFSLI